MGDPYWTSRENSLELIQLSSINEVSLVRVSSCSNTESLEQYGTDLTGSLVTTCLELTELSSLHK